MKGGLFMLNKKNNYSDELYKFGDIIAEKRLYELYKFYAVFEELLKDYEKQKKDTEYLQNRKDYYKHEYFAMCDLYEKSK